MRIRKPTGVQTKSFLFRPGRRLQGTFSIGLAVESPAGGSTAATLEWCGSKRQLIFDSSLSGFVTNLRLPRNLSQGDVYVLSVSAPAILYISVDLHGDAEAVESIGIEAVDGESQTQTVCADPLTQGDRKFEDALVAGDVVKPAKPSAPLGRIESLRPLPEGAVLILVFRRPDAAETVRDALITVSVGEMRRLCIIAAGRSEVSASFWLQPREAGEIWPLTLTCDRPFTWSGAAQRGFDQVFLPAFSLMK